MIITQAQRAQDFLALLQASPGQPVALSRIPARHRNSNNKWTARGVVARLRQAGEFILANGQEAIWLPAEPREISARDVWDCVETARKARGKLTRPNTIIKRGLLALLRRYGLMPRAAFGRLYEQCGYTGLTAFGDHVAALRRDGHEITRYYAAKRLTWYRYAGYSPPESTPRNDAIAAAQSPPRAYPPLTIAELVDYRAVLISPAEREAYCQREYDLHPARAGAQAVYGPYAVARAFAKQEGLKSWRSYRGERF